MFDEIELELGFCESLFMYSTEKYVKTLARDDAKELAIGLYRELIEREEDLEDDRLLTLEFAFAAQLQRMATSDIQRTCYEIAQGIIISDVLYYEEEDDDE